MTRFSRFRSLYLEGTSLAIPAGKGCEKLTHVQAENGNLIREVDYAQIFGYIGEKETEQMLALIALATSAASEIFPGVRVPEGEAEIKLGYQVTKE